MTDETERDNEGRPTFFCRGHDVRAAGFTLYARDQDQTYVLLMHHKNWRNWLEDPGGKSDVSDWDVETTAAREVWEETNHAWDYCDLLHQAYTAPYLVIPNSKYVHFFVEVQWFSDLTIFGDREAYDGYDRDFYWVPVDSLNQVRLNPRLDRAWRECARSLGQKNS